jgi:chromosome segregation ATPase
LARDVLEEILSAALHEKAIAQGRVADFAAGLRDRARLILEERLRPVLDRVDTLEKENAWRAASIESLSEANVLIADENERLKDESRRVRDENARVRDEMGRLKDENGRVKDENARVREEHARLQDETLRLKEESRSLQDECQRLKEEMEGVRAEWHTASSAHDRLLGHHRGVMRGTAESLAAVSALPFWKTAQARARLGDLAAALRRDTA